MRAGDEIAFYQAKKGQRVAITMETGERVAAEFVAHTDGRRGVSYVSFRPLTGDRRVRKVFSSAIANLQAL